MGRAEMNRNRGIRQNKLFPYKKSLITINRHINIKPQTGLILLL